MQKPWIFTQPAPLGLHYHAAVLQASTCRLNACRSCQLGKWLGWTHLYSILLLPLHWAIILYAFNSDKAMFLFSGFSNTDSHKYVSLSRYQGKPYLPGGASVLQIDAQPFQTHQRETTCHLGGRNYHKRLPIQPDVEATLSPLSLLVHSRLLEGTLTHLTTHHVFPWNTQPSFIRMYFWTWAQRS